MTDPASTNIDRLLVLPFENSDNNPTKNSFFYYYYMPLVEIKDFNLLIDNKSFFDQPVKQTRSLWKSRRNVKKQWLYNGKLIRLFVTSNIL